MIDGLRTLERLLPGERPCPNPVATVLLTAGEPEPADAPPCPRCGEVHAVAITETIIEPGEGS